jgi:hypothetical protein
MSKISRNQPCHCRSGKKYKHCCLLRHQAGLPAAPPRREEVSLLREVEKIQQAAMRLQECCRETGVFIFFSTKEGDAWVLETTERDAFQAAAAGKPLPPPVQEDAELIEVDWSHAFALRGRRLFLADHESGEETELASAPTVQISSAARRIEKRYPAELLRQVHTRSASV